MHSNRFYSKELTAKYKEYNVRNQLHYIRYLILLKISNFSIEILIHWNIYIYIFNNNILKSLIKDNLKDIKL